MSNRVSIGKATDFRPNKPRTVNVNGKEIVVAQTGNGYCAVINRCPHMNLPLGGGKVVGTSITCPFHNSRYDMCTGENLDWVQGAFGVKMPAWTRRVIAMGKQPEPVQTFTVIEEDGELFIEA
jgi:nitrite reductase/ring-hydroxylating ferredoxin subunit